MKIELNEVYQTDNYKFVFVEADVDVYLDYAKDHDYVSFILFCSVLDKKNKNVAFYEKVFRQGNSATVYEFIKRFMADSNFRVSYLANGTHIEETFVETSLISPKCKKLINDLLKKKPSQLRFNDFVQLKTFGRDNVSLMTAETLRNKVSKADCKLVEQEFPDTASQLATLRWIVRGLPADYAIRKIKTDLEVQANYELSLKKKGTKI